MESGLTITDFTRGLRTVDEVEADDDIAVTPVMTAVGLRGRVDVVRGSIVGRSCRDGIITVRGRVMNLGSGALDLDLDLDLESPGRR